MSEARENGVEAYLDKAVREVGGLTRKWVAPGRRGQPDRLCFFPRGYLVIVETKRPVGGTLSPDQEREIRRLLDLGFDVRVISDRIGVRHLIAEYK